MKIATFNVNSLRKRLTLVMDWLQRHKPDVLCLQETKVQDADFPALALASTGYHVTFRGVKSYSGVAVLSRTEPEAVSYGLDDGGSPDEERLLRVVVRGIPIVNTYVPQGFELDSNKGWRIDHILATPSLAEHCMKCDVDVEPRRDPNPSDHTFLWAEFAM